jgi:hypothetical protein
VVLAATQKLGWRGTLRAWHYATLHPDASAILVQRLDVCVLSHPLFSLKQFRFSPQFYLLIIPLPFSYNQNDLHIASSLFRVSQERLRLEH